MFLSRLAFPTVFVYTSCLYIYSKTIIKRLRGILYIGLSWPYQSHTVSKTIFTFANLNNNKTYQSEFFILYTKFLWIKFSLRTQTSSSFWKEAVPMWHLWVLLFSSWYQGHEKKIMEKINLNFFLKTHTSSNVTYVTIAVFKLILKNKKKAWRKKSQCFSKNTH